MSASTVRHRDHTTADSLTAYLDEIRAFPLLSREEEGELARRIRTGDRAALDRLVCCNLRFVVSVAKKYQHQGVSLIDLVNEGNLGLMRAAERFDDAKGVKFISYAVWWVRQAVIQAIAEHGHAVRLPVARAGTLYRLGRQAEALRQELGREPTQGEIAAGLEPADADVATAIPFLRSTISLDAPTGESEDGNLFDYLSDNTAPTPDRDSTEHNLADAVQSALAHLRPRDARILRLYFGFDGEEPMTLEAIGSLLGITRERVRQLRDKALSKLRRSQTGAVLSSLRDR